jgi:hypothetical protein
MQIGRSAGALARKRVATALLRHVQAHFGGNLQRAALTLGYDRRRLHSYTSERSFLSDEAVDKIKETWGLDLLNVDAVPDAGPTASSVKWSAVEGQLSLFDPPVRLANEGVALILERKGAAIAVSITISPDAKIA